GDAYVRASRECGSPEAAIAAVSPLRALDRCDDAIAALRGVWPLVRGRAEVGISVLDGVAACSDAITLRRNLAFVPADVVDDYFALLAARHREAERAERRAEEQRREQEAESRAAEAASNCRSECNSAVSSCESSCSADASCIQSCSSL